MELFSYLWGGGFVVFGTILAAAAIAYSRASEKKFRETLAGGLGGLEVRWDEKRNAFQWQNRRYRYERQQGSRNSPPSFSVFLECGATGGDFEVTGESGFDRFFKQIGVTREVQTGDEAFDQRFYIASDAPLFARECFNLPERREAARRLFEKNAAKIAHRGNVLSVLWKGRSSHTEGASNLKETVEILAVLAQDLPQNREVLSPAGTGEGVCSSYRAWVIGLAAGSLATGLISVIWASSSYPVFDAGELFLFTLKFSLPALAVFLYFAVTTLAGNSRSHRDILLAGFLALAGSLLLGCGIAGLYNGMNDISAPEGHTTMIVDKHIHRSKNSKTYKLIVRSWRQGHTIEDLTTNSRNYSKVVPGKDRAVVYTKPGKLGFEWLVSYRLVK